jgi:hypothetical protein
MPNGRTKMHTGDGSAIARIMNIEQKGTIRKAWTKRCHKTEQDA